MINQETIKEVANIIHDHQVDSFQKGIDEKLEDCVVEMFLSCNTQDEFKEKKDNVLELIERLKTIISNQI